MTTRIAMALACACVIFAAPSPAAQRTFVATTGNDANTALNCSLANPCRSFAGTAWRSSPMSRADTPT